MPSEVLSAQGIGGQTAPHPVGRTAPWEEAGHRGAERRGGAAPRGCGAGEGCRRSLRVLRGAFPMAYDWSAGDRAALGEEGSSKRQQQRQGPEAGGCSGCSERSRAPRWSGLWDGAVARVALPGALVLTTRGRVPSHPGLLLRKQGCLAGKRLGRKGQGPAFGPGPSGRRVPGLPPGPALCACRRRPGLWALSWARR